MGLCTELYGKGTEQEYDQSPGQNHLLGDPSLVRPCCTFSCSPGYSWTPALVTHPEM